MRQKNYYTAQDIHMEKLNCAEDRHVRWTTYQNLKLWFDSWENFLVEFGFTTHDTDGELVTAQELMHQILNIDETCLSLDGSNGNRGGCPAVTYYDICFPQLRRATSKSALTTMMISGSNVAGELISPPFQFQMAVQTDKAKVIRVETIWYMLDVQATFEYKEVQSFPVSIGLNKMEQTHLGHMEALKKKELVLAACAMSQEEFDHLVADRQSAASK